MLCENNDAGMFVTLFVALLDVRNGNFTYMNADHNPPLYASYGEPFEQLPVPRNMLAGLHAEAEYQTMCTVLHPGDIVVLYTDGVTEAENDAEEFFSLERTRNILTTYRLATMETMVNALRDDIIVFSNGAVQSDDITLLAFRFPQSTHAQ